jgi:hypothetical protein|tara:strand:+ start:2175 stop:2369 length:195 start_codon:yes stop_codon:yes gene_type:complete
MNVLNLEKYNIKELKLDEQESTNGGEIVSGVAAVAVIVGVSLGAVLIGAAVGYGVYRLVSWATS